MAEQIVCFPYCRLGDAFRLMSPRPEVWFICQKCGHTPMPQKSWFKCFCLGEGSCAAVGRTLDAETADELSPIRANEKLA
jgi:hypothetical protein